MLPGYRPGQTILVTHNRNVKIGDVVIAFQHGREVLKRISQMKSGRVLLESDNSDETASNQQQGWLVDRHIVGKVIWPKKPKRKLAD